MKTITKDDIEISPYIPPVFPDDAIVAIDIELFGAKKGKLHRPIGDFACLSLSADGKTVYTIDDVNQLPLLERSLERCWVGFHNAAFDVKHLRRWMKYPVTEKIYDTMLMDRILWGGYFDRFRLKDLARRYLKIYVEKEAVELFEKAEVLTDEMLMMNAVDAAITWRVLQEQLRIMKDCHHNVWNDIDQPAMWAFMDFKGPMIDTQQWQEVGERNKAKSELLKATFPFNPNAPAQVKSYLNRELHLKVADTNESTIGKFASKHQIVADLLEYRGVSKRASTYGLNWLENVEEDGRVYTSYDVNRAESGRTASSNPNLQNIPVRETSEYRSCFIAAPGHVLVGADYGQQEVRVMAWQSGDEGLARIFQSGGDVYSLVASDIHERTINKEDKERKGAKGVVLGAIFGLTSKGLARELNISEEDAQKLLDSFFNKFPKVLTWMNKQRNRTKYVETAYGRRCWINPWNGQWERNVLNSPVQGSAADMMKMAVGLFHKRWDCRLEPFPLILQVHDELVAEVREENVEYTKELLHRCMVEAGEKMIPGIPVVVDIKVGCSWATVH